MKGLILLGCFYNLQCCKVIFSPIQLCPFCFSGWSFFCWSALTRSVGREAPRLLDRSC